MEYFVCEIETLKKKKMISIKIKNRDILVAYTENGIYAIHDKCPHRGSLLSNGNLENGIIKCKDHGLPISLETGKVTNLKIADSLNLDEYSLDVRCYKVAIKESSVYLLI